MRDKEDDWMAQDIDKSYYPIAGDTKEAAKRRGEVFDTLDDVVCPNHPGAKFKKSGGFQEAILPTGKRIRSCGL